MKFNAMLRSLILLIDHVLKSHPNVDKPILLLLGHHLDNFLLFMRHMQLELFIKIHAFTETSYHDYLTTSMNSSDIQNRMDLHELQRRNMRHSKGKELFK